MLGLTMFLLFYAHYKNYIAIAKIVAVELI